MTVKLSYQEKNTDSLVYVNSKIKICIFCGNDKIESHEFGVSCEECGTELRRKKC